jgi:hypothetical protein
MALKSSLDRGTEREHASETTGYETNPQQMSSVDK